MFAQENVMDFQKVKELALANGFSLKEQASGNMDLHSYVYEFANAIEQAVKAHEAEKLKGCVLVPVQCPDPDFADSLFDELSKKAIGEFGDDLLIHFSDIDEEKIWALMVEAAKAQAAPEGFILVDKHQLAQLMANMDSFGKKALGDDYVSFADIAAVLDEAQEQSDV